jgi:hypothetical protein
MYEFLTFQIQNVQITSDRALIQSFVVVLDL